MSSTQSLFNLLFLFARRPLALLAMLALPSAVAAMPAPSGLWRFEDGTVVEFVACGATRCAVVRGLPSAEADKRQAQNAPECGTTLIGDLKPRRAWFAGWVLDPESGKRYSAELTRSKPGTLQLSVSAMGGLYNETYALQSVAGAYQACRR